MVLLRPARDCSEQKLTIFLTSIDKSIDTNTDRLHRLNMTPSQQDLDMDDHFLPHTALIVGGVVLFFIIVLPTLCSSRSNEQHDSKED
jgi:hypothetical protein